MKKGIMGLCLLFAVLRIMTLPVLADTGGQGAIRVTLRRGNTYASGGSLTLYMVGEEISGGYRLKEIYGGGVVSMKDTRLSELPQWLADRAENGMTEEIDPEGAVAFTGLRAGLYLVVQTEASEGFSSIKPFLVRLPWMEEQWYLEASPKLEPIPQAPPMTGESLLPQISLLMMLLSGTGLVLCWWWKKRMGFEDFI